MQARTKDRILTALHGLSTANWYEFGRSPALCARYLRNLRLGRHKYIDDRITCGEPDCWSLYRDLCARYPDESKPLYLDCEDAASAHAGWMAAQCWRGVNIGFVPGERVSHAIVGIKSRDGKMRIVDPCLWYGMQSTSYAGAIYRELTRP